MKNLKRILLTVIASAISLQAQAGVSEYVAQAKAFACNHKGKIAIGVSAAIIAGVAYYYMRSKKAHAPVARQTSVLRPQYANQRNNNVDVQRLHEIVDGVPGANEFLGACGVTLEEIVQGTANQFTHGGRQRPLFPDMRVDSETLNRYQELADLSRRRAAELISDMNAAHNKTTQQIDESQMGVAEAQPYIEEFIIPDENDSGAGVNFSDDEESSNEDNNNYDDSFEPSLFNNGSDDKESTDNMQESIKNLDESFIRLPALGELTDSFVLPEAERVDKHQHIAIAVAVDPVKYILGSISKYLEIIKVKHNDEQEMSLAIENIRLLYNAKSYPIKSAVINPVAAEGLDKIINDIISKLNNKNYKSLIAEYERGIASLQYFVDEVQ